MVDQKECPCISCRWFHRRGVSCRFALKSIKIVIPRQAPVSLKERFTDRLVGRLISFQTKHFNSKWSSLMVDRLTNILDKTGRRS